MIVKKKIKIPYVKSHCLLMEEEVFENCAHIQELYTISNEVINSTKNYNIKKIDYKDKTHMNILRKFCESNSGFSQATLSFDYSLGITPILVTESRVYLPLIDESSTIWLTPIASNDKEDNKLYYLDESFSLMEVESNNIKLPMPKEFKGMHESFYPALIRMKVLTNKVTEKEMIQMENYCNDKGINIDSILLREDKSLYTKQVQSQMLLENICMGNISDASEKFDAMVKDMSKVNYKSWDSIYEKFAKDIINDDLLEDYDRLDLLNRNSLLFINVQEFLKSDSKLPSRIATLNEFLVENILVNNELSSIRVLKSILEYNMEILSKYDIPNKDIMIESFDICENFIKGKVRYLSECLKLDIGENYHGFILDTELHLNSLIIESMMSDDELTDKMVNNMRVLCNTLENYHEKMSSNEAITEGKFGDTVRKTTSAIAKGSEKAANSIRKFGSDVKRNLGPLGKVHEPFVKMFNNTVNKMKQMDSRERREKLITGNYRFKLINYVKKTILIVSSGKVVLNAIGGLSIMGPLMWALGALASLAINKKLDYKERKKILFELESELDIVKEKIDDAKSDGDRNSKYELMRIQKKLEKDILRIKYHLKE